MTRKDHCAQCGAFVKGAEFHPYVFCVLKKAGRNPWEDFKHTAQMLGVEDLPARPPQIKDLPLRRIVPQNELSRRGG